MTPVFYTFNDREQILDIVEAITGGRMHPSWFRIGGVAQDLPDGWEAMVRDFLRLPAAAPGRVRQAGDGEPRSSKARTKGVGAHHPGRRHRVGRHRPEPARLRLRLGPAQEAPVLRLRPVRLRRSRRRRSGDCYDRCLVHIEEMRQSLRIIEQCVDNMPAGPYKSRPSARDAAAEGADTMHDIETLIDHFLERELGAGDPGRRSHRADRGDPRASNGYYLRQRRRQHAPTARASARRRSRTCRRCRSCAAASRCRT